MRRRRRQSAAFSLIELLLVISLMAILAGLILPGSNPGIHDQLQSAASIMAADLAYGRSLAVTHSSYYRIELDLDQNRYVLEHSGANPLLDTLPDSPFRNPEDPPGQHVVRLDDFPHLGPSVRLESVAEIGSLLQPVGDLEFGPLGQTTRSGYTMIWLSAAEGPAKRYILLYVNPVTGLVTVGPYSAHSPPTSLGELDANLVELFQ